MRCSYYQKLVYRSKGRLNESKKFGWRTYCSANCQSQARSKQQILKCSNANCGQLFNRSLSAIKSELAYCSQRCSAIINNSKFPKRKALIKICQYCGKDFSGLEKYCSMICKNKSQTINKQEIITQIKEFYLKNGRVPFKNEFNHYSAARRRFGTWNNAIINANFDPNPVKFSKKHLAKDGHKCDSLAEKIIDDWLFKKKISHMRNTPYGKNNMNADFEINGVLIEFFGLSGELKEYDRLVRKKKKLWKNNKLKAIAIYPQDLFPQNRLGIILREFL